MTINYNIQLEHSHNLLEDFPNQQPGLKNKLNDKKFKTPYRK